MMRQTPDTALWTVDVVALKLTMVQYYLPTFSNGYEEKIEALHTIHMPAVCCDILISSAATTVTRSTAHPRLLCAARPPTGRFDIDISLVSTCYVVAPFDLEVPRRSTTRSYPPLKYLPGVNQLQESAEEAALTMSH